MRRLQSISIKVLATVQVRCIEHGCDLMPKCGSYGAYTLHTVDSRELVVWSSMGEVNLSEVLTTEPEVPTQDDTPF